MRYATDPGESQARSNAKTPAITIKMVTEATIASANLPILSFIPHP
jgi:hypothetical protein